MNDPANHDRLPPHSEESEAALLSCILNDAACLDQCVAAHLTPASFYITRHRVLFDELLQAKEAFKPIDDIIAVRQFLKDHGKLEDVGDDFLCALPDNKSKTTSFDFHLQVVREKQAARNAVAELSDGIERIYSNSQDLDITLADIHRRIEPTLQLRGNGLSDPFTWEQLREPVDHKDSLLGNRFLERGSGCILFGPAGCGKSTAALQAVCEWAAGLKGLHITPDHPLRTVILQTEDSLNDTREALAGILASSIFTPEKLALVEQNLIILPPVPGGTPFELGAKMDSAIVTYKPDLTLVNPLLAFCPGDPSRELGGILYGVIDPIIKRHHIGFLAAHHTPKTNRMDTSGYGEHDHQYQAAGDARVANWPRAMIQIEPVAKGIYRFRIPKRWNRTGWTWDLKPTKERYFRWAEKEIRWVDATPEEAEQATAIEDYNRILEVLPNPDQEGIRREKVRNLAKKKFNIGKDKTDEWLTLAIDDGLAERIMQEAPDTKRKRAFFRRNEAPKL